MKITLNSFLILQFFYIRHVYSTMSMYCLQTLNTSDCNETPTKVFSYYKPGSRCELEVWRGCPTGNKFDTEEECSENCIFRTGEIEKKVKYKLDAKCMLSEEISNCNDKVVHGFKYDKLAMDCVEVDSNCPGNIFEEKLECIQACVRDLTWEEKMKLVSAQQSRELDSILDSFSNSSAADKEGSNTQTTGSGESKTTNDVDNKTTLDSLVVHSGEVIPAEDEKDKKLKGEDGTNTTQLFENKETDSNSTSANNETGPIENGTNVSVDVTTVSIENNANVASNVESEQQTTDQNAITTMKIGTQAQVVVV